LEISSGRILNDHSAHPAQMKQNIIKSFIKRNLKLTDDKYEKEISLKIKRILIENNYPVKQIEKLIKDVLFQKHSNIIHNNNVQQNQDPKFVSLPYVKGLTEKIQYDMRNLENNIKFGNQPLKKLNTIFTNTKTKMRVPKYGACYLIPCKGNNGVQCSCCYIGETKRDPILDRLPEHVRKHKKISNGISNPTTDACLNHAIIKKHNFDFENFKVLDYVGNHFIRKDMESLYIHKYGKSAVNFKVDTQNLGESVKGVVQIFNKYS